MENTRASVQKQRPKGVIGLPESLPISVQKSYSMLTKAERNIGLRKYRPGHSKPILVGEENLLKPALRLMSQYRLRIEEIKGYRSGYKLYPAAGMRPSEGSRKSGGYAIGVHVPRGEHSSTPRYESAKTQLPTHRQENDLWFNLKRPATEGKRSIGRCLSGQASKLATFPSEMRVTVEN
jgi:hypothetical protein